MVEVEDIIARIGHLRPRILFIHLDPSNEANFALLEALHREYPETFVVLLTDKSIHEEHDNTGSGEWCARLLES